MTTSAQYEGRNSRSVGSAEHRNAAVEAAGAVLYNQQLDSRARRLRLRGEAVQSDLSGWRASPKARGERGADKRDPHQAAQCPSFLGEKAADYVTGRDSCLAANARLGLT